MNQNRETLLETYLRYWSLKKEGELILRPCSQLLPVSYQGKKAMLKIALSDEERRGALLMKWWEGQGAALVFKQEDSALLMERAVGTNSLVEMAKTNQDSEATLIICTLIAKLHSLKKAPLSDILVSLETWFRSLKLAATGFGGLFNQANLVAEELLASTQDKVVLHGDIHHQNILDFDSKSWLAIDPKGLFGDRYFDYANLFCNPDLEQALKPGRLKQQLKLVVNLSGLDESRLLKWIFAYAGLSAAWSIEDGESPELALAVAEVAKTELLAT